MRDLNCSKITITDLEELIYHHLSDNAKKCIHDIKNLKEVILIIRKFANKEINFYEFIH